MFEIIYSGDMGDRLSCAEKMDRLPGHYFSRKRKAEPSLRPPPGKDCSIPGHKKYPTWGNGLMLSSIYRWFSGHKPNTRFHPNFI